MTATSGAISTSASEVVEVLVLNSGSSSLKFGVLGVSDAGVTPRLLQELPSFAPSTSFQRIKTALATAGLDMPTAIGHRIVHGGVALREPCLINSTVLQQLRDAIPFAQLHLPEALALVAHALESFPLLPQVACFDTSFHADLPDLARVLPLARSLRTAGIQRYGFHGLACESIIAQLTPLPRRLIIAHLGSGASVTAVHDGCSRDTTMGMTPLGGVIMGTRSGDLDPGVVLHFLRDRQIDSTTLESLLNRESGLRGISGVTGDVRELRRRESTECDARLALDMFCAAISKQIAGMITVLEGLDCLVFTGGIGEHDAVTRTQICRRLGWLGVHLDAERNLVHANLISARASRCSVMVVPARECAQIAYHTATLLRAARTN